jgi:hypothetical protein
MPYIVTHCQHVQDARPWTDVFSRRAVATLEGREVWNALYGVNVPNREDVVDQIAALPGSGGTVTLPDGTVIEVERKGKFYLADVVPHARYLTEAELIDAFNAREQAQGKEMTR